MRGPMQALVWEQARVTGVLAVWIFVVALVAQVPVFLEYYLVWQRGSDYMELSNLCIGVALLGAVLVFLLRQDARGHLVTAYEQRLARLPVRTAPLVLVPLVARLLALAILAGGLWFVRWVLAPEHAFDPAWLLPPLLLYAIVQALSWSRHTITGASWVVVAAFFLFPALAVASGLASFTFAAYYEGLIALARRPAVAIPMLGLSIGYALVGVEGYRRDARYGLPTPAAVWERLTMGGRSKDRAFTTPLEAQIWYEWKRMGWILPAGTVGLTLVLGLLAGAIGFPREIEARAWQYLPYGALLLAAFGASLLTGSGIGRLRGGAAPYPLLRPASSLHLAQARLLVGARSLSYALLPAGALSMVGWWLASADEAAFLLQAYGTGNVALAHVLSLFAGPFLLAAGSAWVLLWATGRSLPLIIGVGTVTLVLSALVLAGGEVDALGGLAMFLLIVTALVWGGLWRLGLQTHLAASLFVVLMVGSVLLVLSGWKDEAVVLTLVFLQILGGTGLVIAVAGKEVLATPRARRLALEIVLAVSLLLVSLLFMVIEELNEPTPSVALTVQLLLVSVIGFLAAFGRSYWRGLVRLRALPMALLLVVLGAVFTWSTTALRDDLVFLQGLTLFALMLVPFFDLPAQIARRRTL